MKHLNEAELIEHYYEESASTADCERHLKACAACAKRYAELRRDLDGVKPLAPPVRGEDYGEQVWQSIRASSAGLRKAETQLEADATLAAARSGQPHARC